MRKRLYIVLAGIGVVLASLSFAAESGPGGTEAAARGTVLATVNGAAITAGAVADTMNRLRAGRGHGPDASRDGDALRKEALDRLILEELAYGKAKAEGLGAIPGEANRRLEELKGRAGGAEGLKKVLETEKRTEDGLLADLEKDIALRRIFAREVSDKVNVSEADVEREYEGEKGKYVTPAKVVVDDIVFFLNPGERASVLRAEEIRGKVLGEKDRNPYNIEPDGTFIVHETESTPEGQGELYREAAKLTPGEFSGVIETTDSLHVVKLKEFSPAKRQPLGEVRDLLRRKLTADARRERLRRWEAELREGAEIEIMDPAGKRR